MVTSLKRRGCPQVNYKRIINGILSKKSDCTRPAVKCKILFVPGINYKHIKY